MHRHLRPPVKPRSRASNTPAAAVYSFDFHSRGGVDESPRREATPLMPRADFYSTRRSAAYISTLILLYIYTIHTRRGPFFCRILSSKQLSRLSSRVHRLYRLLRPYLYYKPSRSPLCPSILLILPIPTNVKLIAPRDPHDFPAVELRNSI